MVDRTLTWRALEGSQLGGPVRRRSAEAVVDRRIPPKGLLDIAATAGCRKEKEEQGDWSREHSPLCFGNWCGWSE